LCLAADADVAAPPPVVAAMAARIAGSRLVVVLNASHMLFIEDPNAVAAEIRRFLVSTLLDGR
jgi:pimeloyl-ACP methyl ester carboxylesterase